MPCTSLHSVDMSMQARLHFLEQDGFLRANRLELLLHILKTFAALGLCRAHCACEARCPALSPSVPSVDAALFFFPILYYFC